MKCCFSCVNDKKTMKNAGFAFLHKAWYTEKEKSANPMKLMSIAMKPLCAPPFPLDYIEEMTALMGGDGRMR